MDALDSDRNKDNECFGSLHKGVSDEGSDGGSEMGPHCTGYRGWRVVRLRKTIRDVVHTPRWEEEGWHEEGELKKVERVDVSASRVFIREVTHRCVYLCPD